MTRVQAGRMAAMNRRVWDTISDPWQRRQDGGYGWRFFKRGGSVITVEVHRLMGPVKRLALLDMQCGSGEAALSWANRGARVTGVDISERRLVEARKKAEIAGRKITYVRGNVVRLPFRNGTFDRIYTGGGIVGWIPDVNRWAREIALVLKPGGRFVYDCNHPFTLCITEGRGRLPVLARARGGYFDSRPLAYYSMTTWMKTKRRVAQVERNWSMSALLNALSGAGLRLVRVEEFPEDSGLGRAPLPGPWRRAFPVGLAMRWDKPR